MPIIESEFTRYFENLLSSYDIVSALPQLKVIAPFHKETVFNRSSAFTLDGEIASKLCTGGAYRSFEGSSKEAKNITSILSNFIFEDRYKESFVFTTNKAWSDWFFDIAWDFTWIVFDEHKSRLWLVCITDTD
ncbi:hypothetical protein FU659_05110 [Paenibacillus sp. N3.4]|nr:hypothetical protein FU659_05110 [Paenibacillus sp. N3.4]